MANTLVRYKMMSALVNVEPLSSEKFKEILRGHRQFIASGGGGGRWQTVVTPGGEETGLVLGIYLPPSKETQGAQADFSQKRLTGLKLRKVKLSYANFCGAFGQEQDFSEANLDGSLLTDADFSRACFRGAKLARTDFSRTDLIGCDLRDADLSGADLEWADLSGADLTGANLSGVRFVNTRLEGAQVNAAPLLWQAARDGNLDLIGLALRLGADVNERGPYGDTALNLAAEQGHIEIVTRLLEAGAELENAGGADHTPLMQAAFGGHLGVVRLLLEKGARINRSLLSGLQTKANILEENAENGMVNPEAARAWRSFLEFMLEKWQEQNPPV